MATLPTPLASLDAVAGVSIPATWGDTVKDYFNFFLNLPACRAYSTGAVSIPNNTTPVTPIPLNAERYDTDGLHSTTTNPSRLTIVTAGVYHLGGQLRFAANGTGQRNAIIRLNGTTEIANTIAQPISGQVTSVPVSCDYKLGVGDYVELCAFQNSGGALDVNASSQYSPEFWCHWVSAG